jgi:hypothetical protein
VDLPPDFEEAVEHVTLGGYLSIQNKPAAVVDGLKAGICKQLDSLKYVAFESFDKACTEHFHDVLYPTCSIPEFYGCHHRDSISATVPRLHDRLMSEGIHMLHPGSSNDRGLQHCYDFVSKFLVANCLEARGKSHAVAEEMDDGVRAITFIPEFISGPGSGDVQAMNTLAGGTIPDPSLQPPIAGSMYPAQNSFPQSQFGAVWRFSQQAHGPTAQVQVMQPGPVRTLANLALAQGHAHRGGSQPHARVDLSMGNTGALAGSWQNRQSTGQ